MKKLTKFLVSVGEIGAGKVVGEIALMPIIGNGTLVSGAIKLGVAYAVTELVDNEHIERFAYGIGVDGIEDLFVATGTYAGFKNVFGGVGQRDTTVI